MSNLPSKRVPPVNLNLEFFVPVFEIWERVEHDNNAAFNLAAFPEECCRQLRAQMRDPVYGQMTTNEIRSVLITRCEFQEFDSPNPYHANARFDVSFRVPARLEEKVRRAFEGCFADDEEGL